MRGEKGFTLIELLVVIAIVGILSVIGIYQFAAYKGQTFCSSVETDVKNTVTAEEAYFATYQAYGATAVITTHGATPNSITGLPLQADLSGSIAGTGANCIRPDGTTTFTFDQATGQYTWS